MAPSKDKPMAAGDRVYRRAPTGGAYRTVGIGTLTEILHQTGSCPRCMGGDRAHVLVRWDDAPQEYDEDPAHLIAAEPHSPMGSYSQDAADEARRLRQGAFYCPTTGTIRALSNHCLVVFSPADEIKWTPERSWLKVGPWHFVDVDAGMARHWPAIRSIVHAYPTLGGPALARKIGRVLPPLL